MKLDPFDVFIMEEFT